MAHDLIKFGLVLAVLAVAALVMAGFVSGYLTAFKPGEKGVPSPRADVTGGRSVGAVVTPTPMPSPSPYPPYAMYQPPSAPQALEAPPMMAEAPPFEMPYPSPTAVPSLQPVLMPARPDVSLWYQIIQDLLRFFPGLFSGQFSAFPQWPVRWI